jgi:acyl-CoA thioesterase-2
MTEPAADRERRPIDDPAELFRAQFEFETVLGDHFRAANEHKGFGTRVFGGQVAGQALTAATRTVDVDHHPHSLHAYFLRPGRPGVPIDYDVERTRDGRSFTTRRVLAHQGSENIFEMSCSFNRVADGIDYQMPIADDVPSADDAPTQLDFIPEPERSRIPFELRELGPSEPDERGWYPSSRRAWMRVRGELPDDPLLHACMLTYLSDMGAVMGAMAPSADYPRERTMAASLDHALWFHRPMRADRWFLYDFQTVSNHGGRGLCRGTMHTADGTLGVSMAQEALLRVVPE